MGITVGDNFDHKSKKPLDGRVQYATLAAMKAVSDANIYEGCTAFCVETGKEYRFLSSNTVDASTGKWREHEGQTYTGGDNVEISNENIISATDTTYSAGDGIVIDSENDNEISADIMPSSDMEEVAYPLPGVRKQGIVYSTKEQVVGEWIDGSTVYQKTVEFDVDTYTDVNNRRNFELFVIDGVENLINSNITYHVNGLNIIGTTCVGNNEVSVQNTSYAYVNENNNKLIGGVQINKTSVSAITRMYGYATLQYTKTIS